jgi:aspartate/methionine/tyrosine aminotransferase
MDFHSLAHAISPRSRAIVLLNPNNPTGSYVRAKERETLNELCQEHRLALIVDEVFLDYSHDRKRRSTFALNQDVLTFTLSGLSKICAVPQMKLAWIAASGPEDDRTEAEQRLEVIADSYLSVGAPVQWAAASLLAQREDIQQQLLERISGNLLELDRQLDSQRPCTRLRVGGGWYAILRVPVTQSDEDLAIKLLQAHRVLVHPGHFYDFPDDGYVVISLIGPNREFREGVSRLLQFLG